MMKAPVIALLTDYGDRDFFAASLKAVILSIQPEAKIVDITHAVRSFDVREGSFVLFGCFKFFPPGTIFVVVVDPGVGTSRPILLVKTSKYYFIAPDNGVLSHVLEADKPERIIRLSNEKFFLAGTGRTFEGRDKMAPAAAWLSHGCPLEEFGPPLRIFKKFKIPKPRFFENSIVGHVLFVDKFGNYITDIPSESVLRLLRSKGKGEPVLRLGKAMTTSFRKTFASSKKGELFYLAGSLGTIEIARREASAYSVLKVKPGARVEISLKSRRT
jgi:S-adenosylmethionine hydrolase